MKIVELNTLTDGQVERLQELMRQLDAEIGVTPGMLREAAASPATHLFAAVEELAAPGTPAAPDAASAATDSAAILGCASLCVFASPTGRKATIEDVVVDAGQRGRHIGRSLIEHIIGYALTHLAPVEIHLTSRPHRVAANALYKAIGFKQKETNVYILHI